MVKNLSYRKRKKSKKMGKIKKKKNYIALVFEKPSTIHSFTFPFWRAAAYFFSNNLISGNPLLKDFFLLTYSGYFSNKYFTASNCFSYLSL